MSVGHYSSLHFKVSEGKSFLQFQKSYLGSMIQQSIQISLNCKSWPHCPAEYKLPNIWGLSCPLRKWVGGCITGLLNLKFPTFASSRYISCSLQPWGAASWSKHASDFPMGFLQQDNVMQSFSTPEASGAVLTMKGLWICRVVNNPKITCLGFLRDICFLWYCAVTWVLKCSQLLFIIKYPQTHLLSDSVTKDLDWSLRRLWTPLF